MKIGIYIYDNCEVLDFAGPFEVFNTAKRLAENDWEIFLIAEENNNIVKARGNFSINPDFSIKSHPPIDVLIISGGVHNNEITKKNVIKWIQQISINTKKTASVCTGAFFLAEAGLLENLEVTTHSEDIKDLQLYKNIKVVKNKRWINHEKIITSAGISAGIDMSLFLVSELSSYELAEKTAKQMEYDWKKEI